MEPYYTIMRLPGEATEEFIHLALFNPTRRDNMIAWARRALRPPALRAARLPTQKNIYGPLLIDARIDQDPIISQQLSLWNQRGSTVIRGSLLAIPIEQSLIYVQPLYLAAEQGAPPELRRVTVVYGNLDEQGEGARPAGARDLHQRAAGPAPRIGGVRRGAKEAGGDAAVDLALSPQRKIMVEVLAVGRRRSAIGRAVRRQMPSESPR